MSVPKQSVTQSHAPEVTSNEHCPSRFSKAHPAESVLLGFLRVKYFALVFSAYEFTAMLNHHFQTPLQSPPPPPRGFIGRVLMYMFRWIASTCICFFFGGGEGNFRLLWFLDELELPFLTADLICTADRLYSLRIYISRPFFRRTSLICVPFLLLPSR
jgi:hypothetical protein